MLGLHLQSWVCAGPCDARVSSRLSLLTQADKVIMATNLLWPLREDLTGAPIEVQVTPTGGYRHSPFSISPPERATAGGWVHSPISDSERINLLQRVYRLDTPLFNYRLTNREALSLSGEAQIEIKMSWDCVWLTGRLGCVAVGADPDTVPFCFAELMVY